MSVLLGLQSGEPVPGLIRLHPLGVFLQKGLQRGRRCIVLDCLPVLCTLQRRQIVSGFLRMYAAALSLEVCVVGLCGIGGACRGPGLLLLEREYPSAGIVRMFIATVLLQE